MIFTTIYPDAVNSLFTTAKNKDMRIIAGEVMGDRNLPPYLVQSPEIATTETIQLINKWHNQPGPTRTSLKTKKKPNGLISCSAQKIILIFMIVIIF